MKTTPPVRRRAELRVPPRRALPEPGALKLPSGYYDPDSAGFDGAPPTDIEELYRSTTPANPAEAIRARS
jgi:hypothetical protein